MTQLLLDLQLEPIPTLDNFIPGHNAELISRLSMLADRACFDALYLWGPSGSGKSHLLAATAALAAAKRPVHLLSGSAVDADFITKPGALVIVDDISLLAEESQIALFRLFNAARLAGLALLLSGPTPPLHLKLREDLRTRVGQMLVFEVQSLSDDDKAAALRRHALLRGMRVDDNLVHYLLSRGRRDLPSLMAVLDNLDRTSLEQQRAPTLPLLKEVMQLPLDAPDT